MRTKLATGIFVIGTLLTPVLASAADDRDADRSSPKAFVKDSVITTKVKAKLAKEKLGSLKHVKVDTDNKGVVYLSGSADSQEDVDKAASIARSTEGVVSVQNDLKVVKDK
jgi:hyperosmotically inducible protein